MWEPILVQSVWVSCSIRAFKHRVIRLKEGVMQKRFGGIGIAVLALLSACGGGGGHGGNQTTSSGLTGVCDSCATDSDCEDGLVCQPCSQDCSGSALRCTGSAGGAADVLSCQDGLYPAGCANIAGTWALSEDADISCTMDGDTEPLDASGSAVVTFVQQGCQVSYRVPGLDVERRGIVVGNRLRLSGPFLVATESGVSIRDNVVTVEGTVQGRQMQLTGSAHGSGSSHGHPFTCDGSSTANAYR